MKIIVDIGHPAHVHFYKNFIRRMEERGHELVVTARDKDVALPLLKAFDIEYEVVGKIGKGKFDLAREWVERDRKVYSIAKRFHPSILTGVHNPCVAHIARLTKAKSIIFTDTEHAKMANWVTFPFADVICTPSCFKKDLGKKQVRYNGYHELAYLHPNYFKPDPSVLDELGLKKDDKFVIVRFVAWQASHDIGQRGFGKTTKLRLVTELEKYATVFITSESPLPEEFKNHRLTIPPERIHDLLYYATMYIGEGATMASECATLGVPAIYTNPLRLGYLDEQEEGYGLIYNLQDAEKVVQKATQLFQQQDLKQEWARKRKRLLKDKIDVTQFMMNFIENYPQSLKQRFMRG